MPTPRTGNPPGQPSKYKREYAKQAKKLCLLGATDMQLADFFGVSKRTIDGWKMDHAEFLRSLKLGKAEPDAAVKRSLFQRAMGYEQDSEKIFCNKDGDVTRVNYREVIPPDTTACIFWLKNRQPAEWRDKQELEHTFSDLAATIAEARKRVGK